MSNKYWNNQHGANFGHPPVKEPGGSKPKSGSEKVANWPGVPGKTQSKDRSAGQPKKGWKGPFQVKQQGL